MFKSQILSVFAAVVWIAATNGSGFPGRSALFRRQGATLEPTDIPPECTNICAPLFSDVQSCGSLNAACLCTATVRQDAVNCANCVASIFPSELSTLQAGSDANVQLCTQEGHPVDPVKLTGTISSPASITPTVASASGGNAGSGSGSSTTNSGVETTTTATPTKPNGGSMLNPSTSIFGLSAALLLWML